VPAFIDPPVMEMDCAPAAAVMTGVLDTLQLVEAADGDAIMNPLVVVPQPVLSVNDTLVNGLVESLDKVIVRVEILFGATVVG
jgi:hypothetical protein